MATFTIPGKPFGKQRPRVGVIAGHARVFTPKETVSFERQVGQIAASLFPRPIDGPVEMHIRAVFEAPPSWSRKKRAALLGTPHTSKPDLSNLIKAIEDGLNRIAYADDGQIAFQSSRKVWGERAETIVQVEPLGPWAGH